MTDQPQPFQPHPFQPHQTAWTPPPPPPSPTRRIWLFLLPAAAVVLAGVATVVFYTVTSDTIKNLSRDTAQRACRTAVEAEWEKRQNAVTSENTGGSGSVLVSTQGIDLQETWQSGDIWSVNAVIRYTLTTWPVDPVADTVSLTCTASGTDEAPVTAVVNR